MYRFLVAVFFLCCLWSCSKDNGYPMPPPSVIPADLQGGITEFTLAPLDINTPDKGSFEVFANNTLYQVDFDAVPEASSNATISFRSDTILTDLSREFANVGPDAVAYFPVAINQVVVYFKDGRKVTGFFNGNSSFGGIFGAALISQWRTPNDPTKPNQKAMDDLIHLVERYADADGPGSGTSPQFLSATVSKN